MSLSLSGTSPAAAAADNYDSAVSRTDAVQVPMTTDEDDYITVHGDYHPYEQLRF